MSHVVEKICSFYFNKYVYKEKMEKILIFNNGFLSRIVSKIKSKLHQLLRDGVIDAAKYYTKLMVLLPQ